MVVDCRYYGIGSVYPEISDTYQEISGAYCAINGAYWQIIVYIFMLRVLTHLMEQVLSV